MRANLGSQATSGLCQPIIALMPPYETPVESRLGGGAIMQRKPPAALDIGIGRNERGLQQFQYPYPAELVHGCAHRLLSDFEHRGRELVYCDPLYLHVTRSGERHYRFEYEGRDHLDSPPFAQAYCRISSYLQTIANQGSHPLVATEMALSGQCYAQNW